MSDFDGYIRIMSDRLRRFEDSRQRAAQVPEGEQRLSLVDIAAGEAMPHCCTVPVKFVHIGAGGPSPQCFIARVKFVDTVAHEQLSPCFLIPLNFVDSRPG